MKQIIKIILKYKLLHFCYWIVTLTIFLHYRQERFGGSFISDLPTSLVIFSGKIFAVYFVIYRLIPKFLYQKKYLFFTLGCISAMLFASLFTSTIILASHHVFASVWVHELLISTLSQTVDMISDVIVFVLAVTIYAGYENDQRIGLLERERLETELNFLKAQVNPHFLFNALNSIYVLIDLDKRAAEEAMVRFSGLLRYQLYECTENVLIERELTFLKDYIGLESLRKENSLHISFRYPEDIPFVSIAPFILATFVENAFKHVSRSSLQNNFIDVQAQFRKGCFIFSVTNSIEKTENKETEGGIGLKNVRRRLQLLYPNKHALHIHQTDTLYRINLEMHE